MIESIVLVPRPRSIVPGSGRLALPHAEPEVRSGAAGIPAEGYRLAIGERGAVIEAADAAGAFYARATLAQLAAACAADGAIPGMTIEDHPDFRERGAMLDVSRDKVPTMETLRRTIDLLASLKYNRLQLYVEHTFAYPQHPEVWADASPLTAEEIEALDAYARRRHIELVPNQNSFGHMERWLKLPRYAPLAEVAVPEGDYMSLCPIDPGSIELLAGLYDAYLPHFASKTFNVGCDETIDLGKGRSAAEVARVGVGRVYLDFLLKIHALVTARGHRMQFWGDIILQHPELIGALPKDLVALNWGYEADHPFDAEGGKFAEAGIAYQVCPGTSTWLSLAGRTTNAIENLWSAARAGRAHGATGMLVTDWGDHGHWQPWPVSFLGLAYGAAMAWCAGSNRDLDLARALDLHVFRDEAKVLGRLACELGDVHRATGVTPKNASVLALLLLFPERPMNEGRFAGLTVDGLESALARADEILPHLGRARSSAYAEEFALAGDLVRAACRFGIVRLTGRGGRDLAGELEDVVARYRRSWLARNRPGGLADSAARFDKILETLRA